MKNPWRVLVVSTAIAFGVGFAIGTSTRGQEIKKLRTSNESLERENADRLQRQLKFYFSDQSCQEGYQKCKDGLATVQAENEQLRDGARTLTLVQAENEQLRDRVRTLTLILATQPEQIDVRVRHDP